MNEGRWFKPERIERSPQELYESLGKLLEFEPSEELLAMRQDMMHIMDREIRGEIDTNTTDQLLNPIIQHYILVAREAADSDITRLGATLDIANTFRNCGRIDDAYNELFGPEGIYLSGSLPEEAVQLLLSIRKLY